MFDHLLVGEAQDGDALTAEEGVAESITSLSRGVGRAVHLDGQFGFDAKEVGEVVADGELSTELEAVDLSAAQQAPEERFGRGGAVAVPAAEHETALGVTTRTVRHPALAQNLRYACNPPIHEGSPSRK